MAVDPLIGAELAGYRIEELVGRGGMGVVYRAEHQLLGRKDALKLLVAELAHDQSFRERFLRESRLAASIEHPNIVPIYGAGEVDGRLYIAMRYVEGTDLRTVLKEAGSIEPQRLVGLIEQVASALDAAHARGLVHRDVKPANILLAGDHVYLSDFGIAKHTATRGGLTMTGSFVGTLDYSAPEQIEGKHLDGRADLYSLGCLVFQCLTGHVPYEKDSEVQLIYAHLLELPPPVTSLRPDLPPGMDDVVQRAVAKKPDDRFPTVGEFAQALRREVSSRPAGAGPTVTARRAAPPRPPHPQTPPADAAPPPITFPPATDQPPPEVVATPAGGAEPFAARPAPPKTGRTMSGRAIALAAGAGALVIAAVVGLVVTRGGSAFPNAQEASLLTSVPVALRAGCGRADEADEIGAASASVACRAGGQVVSYHRFADRSSLSNVYSAERRRLAVVAETGSCGELPLVGDRAYAAGTRTPGRIVCARQQTGPAEIGWTDRRSLVYALAQRADGREGPLIEWWRRSAGPLPPGGRRVEVRRATLSPGGVLYRETFSTPARGWARTNDAAAQRAYARGRYLIVVKRPQSLVPASTAALDRPLDFGDARVEVTATRDGGARSLGFGILCRSQRSNDAPNTFYTLQVQTDGSAVIRRRVGGAARRTLVTKPFPRRILRPGSNRIAAVCAGGSGSVRLALLLNGREIASARDPNSLGPSGFVGFFASSRTAGNVRVAFDDFVVRKLR